MNIFCFSPRAADAVAFYRDTQPLGHLRKLMPELNLFHVSDQIVMKDLAHIDVAYMQRPCNPDHIKFIELCHDLGVKVWVDYDDNLFAVPTDNKSAYIFNNQERRDRIIEICRKADAVSVSTNRLSEDLTKITHVSGIKVIPNAFNDYILKDTPTLQPHNIVAWRGSDTHQRDLAHFAEGIVNTAKRNAGWLFSFMGYNPWFIVEHIEKQSKVTPPMDVLKYHQLLRHTYPNIMIVPLADHAFNRAKSNIAWIEATYAGAVTLAPAWEEWKKPGVICYEGSHHFTQLLQELMKADPDKMTEHHAESWNYISTHLRLSKVNQLRVDLLKELT